MIVTEENLMTYKRVTQLQSRTIIGTKQTLKAMANGGVSEVFIAEDVDHHITSQVLNETIKQGISDTHVDSINRLEEACNIDVSASVVASRTDYRAQNKLNSYVKK